MTGMSNQELKATGAPKKSLVHTLLNDMEISQRIVLQLDPQYS